MAASSNIRAEVSRRNAAPRTHHAPHRIVLEAAYFAGPHVNVADYLQPFLSHVIGELVSTQCVSANGAPAEATQWASRMLEARPPARPFA